MSTDISETDASRLEWVTPLLSIYLLHVLCLVSFWANFKQLPVFFTLLLCVFRQDARTWQSSSENLLDMFHFFFFLHRIGIGVGVGVEKHLCKCRILSECQIAQYLQTD